MTSAVDFYARSLDCIHCGLCLPVCPTYRVLGLETESPRGRIYLMRALAEKRIENPERIRVHLDQCLGCRACETACPSGVHYGEILETVREDIERERPTRSIAARLRRFLLWHLVAHQGRLRWAFRIGRACELLGLRWLAFRLRLLPRTIQAIAPPIPKAADRRPLDSLYRPAGSPRGRVKLFTGCIMEQLFGRINRATVDLLVANGFEVEVPRDQTCCGALLLHNAQTEKARELARRNMAAFAGRDPVINNSAGCGAALKEYGHLLGDEHGARFAARCRDISEFLAEVGLRAEPARRDVKVAYDDPCHLCHGQGVRQQPRELLRQVPGLQLIEHERPEDCCGSAGIYNLLQPRLAQAIGENKSSALATSEPDLVATGNPGCMLQIRAHLRAAGSNLPVVHPVELLLP